MEMKERAGNDLVKRIFYAMFCAQCIKTWRLFCPKLPTCKTVYAKKVQIVKIFTKGRVVW